MQFVIDLLSKTITSGVNQRVGGYEDRYSAHRVFINLEVTEAFGPAGAVGKSGGSLTIATRFVVVRQ